MCRHHPLWFSMKYRCETWAVSSLFQLKQILTSWCNNILKTIVWSWPCCLFGALSLVFLASFPGPTFRGVSGDEEHVAVVVLFQQVLIGVIGTATVITKGAENLEKIKKECLMFPLHTKLSGTTLPGVWLKLRTSLAFQVAKGWHCEENTLKPVLIMGISMLNLCICSGNGLSPSGTKPLPELKPTYCHLNP